MSALLVRGNHISRVFISSHWPGLAVSPATQSPSGSIDYKSEYLKLMHMYDVMRAPMLFTTTMFTRLFRLFGYHFSLRLHQIYPFVLSFRLSSSSYTIALDKLTISLHQKPIITAYGYTYTDDQSLVRCDKTVIYLYAFPVSFRQPAGPWLSVILDGLSVRVFTSERTPRWIHLLKNDIFYSILNGETIRLRHLKTRVQFSRPSGSMNQFIDKVLRLAGPQPDRNSCSFTSSQWHIINLRRKMYRFGNLDLTFWRDWDDNTGSITLVSKDSRWSSIPALAHQECRIW